MNIFDQLSEKLVSIMEANPLIQEVYDYERDLLEGNPACMVIPESNEGSYATTTENRRVFAFKVILLVERGSSTIDDYTCEKTMRGLVGSVLDDLDKNWELSGLTVPSGYTTLMMEAAPSAWGYIQREQLYRIAEIEVRIHFNIDTTIIT